MDDHQSENSTDKHEIAVQQLLRARTRLLVCFLTLPLYVLAVWPSSCVHVHVRSLMCICMCMYNSMCMRTESPCSETCRVHS